MTAPDRAIAVFGTSDDATHATACFQVAGEHVETATVSSGAAAAGARAEAASEGRG
jgi:hypothetical protein